MVSHALSRKSVSIGILVHLLTQERPLALKVQSLSNQIVRIDISTPGHALAFKESRSFLMEQIRDDQFDVIGLRFIQDKISFSAERLARIYIHEITHLHGVVALQWVGLMFLRGSQRLEMHQVLIRCTRDREASVAVEIGHVGQLLQSQHPFHDFDTPVSQDQIRTDTCARRTVGYLAPEWLKNAPIIPKVDIFSYGVMLLEITCGRRHIDLSRVKKKSEDDEGDDLLLVNWVAGCMRSGRIDKLARNDPEVLNDVKRLERFVNLGLWCVHPDPILRPSMKMVMQILEGTIERLVEIANQKNSILEEHISHLDGALKECLRQLRQAREEQEQNVQVTVAKTSCEWESRKSELENKRLQHQSQLQSSKSKDSNIHDLQCKLEYVEKQNSILKLELVSISEELKLMTFQRDLSTDDAETASKQQLESVKKVAKLESMKTSPGVRIWEAAAVALDIAALSQRAMLMYWDL
ncbi:Filament-like plant protein [Capsicum baccatum]|uniref:Filament-like plant protein n=1 Tax=Capsicum baccatum TaxID=33114 RepID=A0A2G2VGK2_CAPBA|nr:Filament-like plant protein [Capsicum baccatum]